MTAQGTIPPPAAPSTMCAPPVARRRSPACTESAAANRVMLMAILILLLIMRPSVGHDVALHRRKHAQQLVLLGLPHAVLVERVAQELHQQVHLRLGVLE